MKSENSIRSARRWPRIKRGLVRSLCIAMICGAAHAQTPTANALFERGQQLFNAGRFQEALNAFLLAEQGGVKGTKIHYNLGSTYYRMHRFAEARAEFSKLLDDPGTAARARYNIGLAYLAEDNRSEAARYFEAAARETEDIHVQDYALLGLAKARGTFGKKRSPFAVQDGDKRFQFTISANGGYDDNVTLSAEAEQVGVSNRSDYYGEGLGVARVQLHGSKANGESLNLVGYVKRYTQIDDFDQSLGRAQFNIDRSIGSWGTSLTFSGDQLYLSDKRFYTTGTFGVEARGPIAGKIGASLRYQGSYNDAGKDFDSLTGQRHTVRASLLAASRLGVSEVGYSFETNDRKDFRDRIGQFYSRSPTSNGVFASQAFRVGQRITITPRIDYRHSRYNKADSRLAIDGGLLGLFPQTILVSKRRQDDHLEFDLRSQVDVTKVLFVQGNYHYTDNSSNYDIFSYKQNTVSLGLGGRF